MDEERAPSLQMNCCPSKIRGQHTETAKLPKEHKICLVHTLSQVDFSDVLLIMRSIAAQISVELRLRR